MRQSREAAAETRQKIIKVAARQFRRHGISGISVADVMAKAGLTHGGFYKHFASKEQLAAEACAWALAASQKELIAAAQAAAGRELEAIAGTYLSMAHRDHADWGCAIAALGAEAARLDGQTRAAIAEGYDALVRFIAVHLPQRPGCDPERRARAIVALMVGALTVSRSMSDRTAAERVLDAARKEITETM